MDKKNSIARRIMADMTRMRSQPRLFDYCYWTTKNNLVVFKRLLECTKHLRNSTVIDLGCGNKPFRDLFPIETNYIGIDFFTESAADILHDFRRGIPIAGSSADVVILSEALEHLPNPFLILAEVDRILRPGGHLFISTPFALPIHGRPYDFFRFTEYFYHGLQEHYDLELVQMNYSNSVFSTPLLLLLYILVPLPLFPYLLKQAFALLVNGVVAIGDALINNMMAREGRLVTFTRSFPLGYAALFVKINRDRS